MAAEPSNPVVLGNASRLKAALRPVMAGLAAIFVGVAVWDLRRRWQPGAVDIDYGLAAWSMLPLAAGCLLLALGWVWLLSRMGSVRVPWLPGVALHVESQAARYTPGKVGLPLVRMLGAEQLGTTARIAGSSVLVELLCFVPTGGLMGLLLLLVSGSMLSRLSEAVGWLGLLVLAGFTLGLLLLLLLDRRHFPGKVRSALQLEGTGAVIPPVLPLIHALYWLTWAAHGYLVSQAIHAPADVALASIGFYVLAPVLGFLALATPGGLGVREAVLSVALAGSVGPAAALSAAIISRGTSLVVDFAIWMAFRPLRGNRVRNPR